MTDRRKRASPVEPDAVYRVQLKDLMSLEAAIRHLTLGKFKDDPFKHKIDFPESSYDPLLRESEVVKAIRAWRDTTND